MNAVVPAPPPATAAAGHNVDGDCGQVRRDEDCAHCKPLSVVRDDLSDSEAEAVRALVHGQGVGLANRFAVNDSLKF